MSKSAYKLLYWPTIPGRGEFIRLAFEYAKQPYEQDLDPKSLTRYMKPASTQKGEPYALAPPMLEHDGNILSQTPNILLYLGDALDLAGSKPMHKFYINGLTLTILDLNNEIHDSHHPIAPGLYYEDQKAEALRKAENIRDERIPKFLGYFNNVLDQNATGYLVDDRVTYADLALFQVVDGMQFAFPNLLKTLEQSGKFKAVFELKEKIKSVSQIADYLQSDRRTQYGMGVFRYYPELDST